MKGFTRLTRIDEALKKFLSQVDVVALSAECIPTVGALSKVLAEDVTAEVDVPFFDRSAVDGYALRSEDTFGASSTNPLVFDVLGVVEIGFPSVIVVGKQQALSIATGAAIPGGTDGVMMVEYTERIGKDKLEIHSSVSPGENVSKRGEDVRKGEEILAKGTRLQPQDVGILAALGISKIRVVRSPRVAVLSTGNELVELGNKVDPGRIVDSNRPIIMAMVREIGGEAVDLGIVRDDLCTINSRIAKGVATCDMVLVTGGTSVGSGDLVPEAINTLGRPGVIVHGIAMRPGKPTALAALDGKPIVLLPGFPVAAMISFNTFVKPILLKMLGSSVECDDGKTVRAKMLRRAPSSLGNRTFMRVLVHKLNGEYVAEPLRTSGSGVISSMIKANGLVVIPEDKEGVEEGEEVEVTVLKPIGRQE